MKKYSKNDGLGVTVEELRTVDWQTVLEKATERECYAYFGILASKTDDFEKAGDDRMQRVFTLLALVTNLYPNYDSLVNPYAPIALAEALHKDDVVALAGALDSIKDAELRARVGDVVWESSRNHVAARIAVEAFLESAKTLEPADLWPPFFDRLERALQLAAKLGFGEPLHLKVLAEIEAAIHRHESDVKSGILCCRLMDLLLKHDAGDAARYAALAERFANDFAKANNWNFAEWYWKLAVRWHRKAKNEPEAQRCELAAAECLVSKAEDGLKEGHSSHMFAAHWMGRGVVALRRARADPNRIQSVHQRLLEAQYASLKELDTIEINPAEIPGFLERAEEAQKEARKVVAGKQFQEALFRLAFMVFPSKPSEIRKQVENNAKEFILPHLGGTAILDEDGKVAAQAPPIGVGSPEEKESSIRDHMFQHAKEFTWPTHVRLFIEPARRQILHEHSFRLCDLEFLVASNPFIPDEHEMIYLRGLQSGFHGDWLMAMHLLIPQLENSIRFVLEQKGVVTSTLKSGGIQEDRNLDQLLAEPKAKEVFGEDIVFDLRGILLERFGHNLRNRFAHGEVSSGGFYAEASVYLWWLTLRLCCLGHRCLEKAIAENRSATTPPHTAT